MKIVSWNVNGLRAALKKGFLDWFKSENNDIVCIQETKAAAEQLPREALQIPGYDVFLSRPEQKGYSGVALWTKLKPRSVALDLGIERFDREGRLIQADFGDFILFNVYFPNGKASPERLRFKMDFYQTFLAHLAALKKKGRKLVICGDVNTAHKEIDLARPRENERVSGFLPEERAWMDKFLAAGFVDTLRIFDPHPGRYTWWDLKTGARARNVGWRIDYFFVSENLRANVSGAFIETGVYGSDHCPIGITLDL
ncbi:MAG TPA: exodeoxyribonuclease III [Candidatus Omnitrophota bacterium]|nr:exodeoxyribonuclease III [Candidatus Omnitrophota bacterium]HRZ15507.1 exodeoxyribonuclease III [Candidatus Omnitrophota bacterium]